MSIPSKAQMAVNDKSLIGWKPRAWRKRSRGGMLCGNGRRKPKGPSRMRSPAANRRKARNAAARRHA